MELTLAIGWVCLVLGAVAIAVGVWVTVIYRKQEVPVSTPARPGDHGAVNDAIKNTTEFAKALKDLDMGGKLLTVGILLIAIAAITAGLDNVADAIKSTTGAASSG